MYYHLKQDIRLAYERNKTNYRFEINKFNSNILPTYIFALIARRKAFETFKHIDTYIYNLLLLTIKRLIQLFEIKNWTKKQTSLIIEKRCYYY